MTSPLHGEGRRFEFGRAHRFFFDSEAGIVSDDEDDKEEKLHNSEEDLHNSSDTSNGKKVDPEYAFDEEAEPPEQSPKAEPKLRLVDKLTGDIIYYNHRPEFPKPLPYAIEAKRPEGWTKIRDAAMSESLSPSLSLASDRQVESDIDADAPLVLHFTQEQLEAYVAHRSHGLAKKSHDWINRSAVALWDNTQGEISHDAVKALRDNVLEKYASPESHSKVLGFAKSFLKFLATTKAEPSYQTFAPYLELPKTVKERKGVTSRIVVKEDICNILQYIEGAEQTGETNRQRSAQYSAFILFGAYTGERSEATIAKLTVGQFRTALAHDKPVLEVGSPQDKIRMGHYVPLHPRVVKVLESLLAGRNEDDLKEARVFARGLKEKYI